MAGHDEERLAPRSRRSIFIEESMEEYTPTNSIHDTTSFTDRSRHNGGCLAFWTDGTGRLMLRVVNAALHMGVCCALLAIMIESVVRSWGHIARAQVIIVIVVTALDCCLDIYAVIRLRKDWQGWAIIVRLLLGLGCIAQFLTYIGFKRVFPMHYTYWGMATGYSESVVYLLVLALGIWDMLHTVLRRHTLGRELRQFASSLQARRQHRNQASRLAHENSPTRIAARGTPQMADNSTDPARGSDAEGTIALGLVPHPDDKKGPAVMVVNDSGMSQTSGESSSQRGSAAHIDSVDGTSWASRRTSSSMLDDSRSSVHGEADGTTSLADIKM